MPGAVTVTIDGQNVAVKGPKGELSLVVKAPIEAKLEDGQVVVTRPDDERASRSLHGLSRTLIANLIIGVTEGYEKSLEVVGTGYRVQSKGSGVEFALGYSHSITVEPPAGISFEVEGTNKLTVKGIDKQAVGEVAANIRKLRKPEPYKGKGVRYAGEVVRRKAGKSGKYMATVSKSAQRDRRHARLRKRIAGTAGASAPRRHPFGPPRLRAGRRRQQGPHRGVRVDPRGRPAHASRVTRPRRPRRSASWSPSAPRRPASTPSSSTAEATGSPVASPRSPKAPAREG